MAAPMSTSDKVASRLAGLVQLMQEPTIPIVSFNEVFITFNHWLSIS